MSILKTLTINGTTYEVAPIVPASSVTLLAKAWEGDGDLHSQVVEIPGVTPRTKVDLQPTAEQLEEFYYKILAFSAENDEGVVTVYAIGDRPLGDHTIQITLTEVEGEGKIRGNTVGTPAPRSDWNQTDPRKADYIANKPNAVLYTEQTLTPKQQAQARENIGAEEESYVMDYSGNLLPFDMVDDSYSNNGVTITHENGVFTFNGTATAGASVEIIPRGTPYATLEAGQTYYIAIPSVSGEISSGYVYMYIQTDAEILYQNRVEVTMSGTDEKILTRFTLTITKGVTYNNYKVAPYVGTNPVGDYAGGVKKKIVTQLQESVAQLEADVEQLSSEKLVTTKQALTEEQQVQVRENIGLVQVDYQGNLLPFDMVEDSYTQNGVTMTYENGVFTLNGTCTVNTSVEIVTRGTPYATLKGGVKYTAVVRSIGGEADGQVSFLLNTDTESVAVVTTAMAAAVFSKDEDKVLTRFALGYGIGNTFNDYKVVPYLGTEYDASYAGGVKKDVFISQKDIASLEADVAQLQGTVDSFGLLPASFTDERNRIVPIVQSESADLRLVAFADPHSIDTNKYKKYNELLESGCIDGLIGLGDYNDYGTNTRENTLKYITSMLSHSGRTPNCFYTVGNHDIAFTHSNSGTVTQDNVLTKKEMYDCTCRHLNGVAHYNDDDPYGGYYYVDYNAAKIRMVILNTSDIYEADGSLAYKYTESVMIQQPQVDWFVNKALDFSNKTAPSRWSVLVCCHAPMFILAMLTDILSAVKSGGSVVKEWTFKRRLVDGTTTADQNNPVTISADKDFSGQGAVDVIGVLYGHDHHDILTVSNGIPFVGFISDNAQLDDYYVANVNGLTAGGYCFTAKNGSKFGFTLTEDIADASVFSYNAYLMILGNTTIRFQNADGVTVKESRAKTADYVDGMTEITGFTQERTPDTVLTESCTIVNIDKDAREIRIVPYGTGEHRVVSY